MTTHLLTASGSAAATAPGASILNKGVQKLSASGSAAASGRATIARQLPIGGVTDFGVWAPGQPDSAMSRDMGHVNGSDLTAARGSLTATAPTAYAPTGGAPLWNTAVYAGIGINWTNVANTEQHGFDNIQFEKVTTDNRLSWNATSWEGRRCYTAQAPVTWCTVQASTDVALSGSRSGKIIYAGAPAGTWGYFINPTTPNGMAPCTPGEYLNASVSVSMTRAAWWSAGLQFYDSSFNQIGGAGHWYYSTYQQHPGGGKWDTSFVYNEQVPANSAWVAVVPHVSINSTPSATDSIAPVGEVAYVDVHRIWARPYNLQGTPSPYTSPRKLNITVEANRVNLINNPSFTADTWGWGAFGMGAAPFPVTQDSTVGHTKLGALKFSVPATLATYGPSSTTGPGLLTSWSSSNIGGYGWAPSSTYTSSVWVKLAPGCPTVSINSLGGYPATAGVLSTDQAVNHPELLDGTGWIRLWGTFTTNDQDDGLVGLLLSINSADVAASGMSATFWVDDVLCEAGPQLLDYFDGDSSGSDYLWAGTPHRSSSHYYRGFRASAYRLNDIVKSVAPHGMQYQLLFAQPPS